MFRVLQIYDLTVAKQLRLVYKNAKSEIRVPPARLRQYASDFKPRGKVLFCQAYGKSVVAQQRTQITRYLSGIKHITAVFG
jgi:hypothetical protein